MKKNLFKDEALRLRRSGMTLREVRSHVRVAKSTLSEWFRGDQKSDEVKKRLATKANRDAALRMSALMKKRIDGWQSSYEEARKEARTSFTINKVNPLFLTGLTLYWGEGDNKGKTGAIRVSNSDPSMLRLFRLFLEKYFPDICMKAKMSLILYPDLDDAMCRRSWSRKVGVPLRRFTKSVYILGKSSRRLMTGVGMYGVCSKRNKVRLLQWIDELRSEF